MERHICEVCKSEKRETNHWWTIEEKVIDGKGSTGLRISDWGEGLNPRASIRSGRIKKWIVCGQACALKKISEWMASSRVWPKPEPAALDSASPTSSGPDNP